jgi:membrane-associated protease RseP (regulator of RpoE activity)
MAEFGSLGDEPPGDGPPAAAFDAVFDVKRARADDGRLLYYGEPLAPPEDVERRVWPLFREAGYEVRLTTVPERDPLTGVQTGDEHALVAEPRSIGVNGIPWTNVVLAVLTVLTTLWAGTQWYYIQVDPLANPLSLLGGWPFAVAVLGVLGIHEFGHYVMSRYHGVQASLPYFIPIPSFIGTMGAVIRMRGRMPDRRALFDIGVAGPLAGLVAAVGVTTIGLSLDPVTTPRWVMNSPGAIEFDFNYPLLVHFIADAIGQPLEYADPRTSVNPVVLAGWIGMFFTFMNLLPVGQLDGGHILRAMLGRRQETIAAAVPALLFALAAYLYYVLDSSFNAVFLWVFWGVFAIGIAYAGPATPVDDNSLDAKRIAVGIGTLVLGVLCFTPVPIELVT